MKKFLIALVLGFLMISASAHAAEVSVVAKGSTANSVTVTVTNNGKAGTNPTTGMCYSVFSGTAFAVNPTTNVSDNNANTGQPLCGGGSRDVTITMLKPSTSYSVKIQESSVFYNPSAVIASATIATKSGSQPCTPPKVLVNGTCVSPNPSGGQSGSTPTTTSSPNPSGGQSGSTPTGGNYVPPKNPSGEASGFNLQVRLNNPLKVDTIKDAIQFFVNTLVKIAIPFIVIFFIWAGLKFILAQGKPDKITEAKKMFWYTIIGTLLILGAWTITNAIIGTVNSITN